MIRIGGSGSWDVMNGLLQGIAIPPMVRLRQKFTRTPAVDVAKSITEQFNDRNILAPLRPGQTVAIAVGSRGIANQVLAVSTMVKLVQEKGGVPFLVPAMGSHAGATAQGQKAMLERLGFCQETVSAPIRSSMETKELGRSASGMPVLADRLACEADHMIIINRIKPHVCFRGPYESGLYKLVAIGLGKQRGADIAHNLGFGKMASHIPEIARYSLGKLKLLCAVGLVENAWNETAICRVLHKEEIDREEPQLLDRARELAARLHFDRLDALVIDEIGKHISGSGFDTNVVGRYHSAWISGGPQIARLLILDIAEQSNGNGNGLGMADFTTRRAAEKFDFEQTYPNNLTATLTGGSKIPMVLPNDKQAIQCCIKTCNLPDRAAFTMARIRNTGSLNEIEVSENLAASLGGDKRFELLSEPYELAFDQEGNLF